MPFTTTNLSNYTPNMQEGQELLSRGFLQSKTLKLLFSQGQVMTGVKTSENFVIADYGVTLSSGNQCSWSPTGGTDISSKPVSVGEGALQEEYCFKDLKAKITQIDMQRGANNDNAPIYEQEIVTGKIEALGEVHEIAVWQGDTASGSANLNKYDGLLKQIDAAANEILVNSTTYLAAQITTAGGGIKDSNVIGIFDGMVKSIPAKRKARKDYYIFCGTDVATLYGVALKNANMFNYVQVQDGETEFIVPGTSYRVIPVNGLDGTSRIIGVSMKDLGVATDMEHDEEKVEFSYDSNSKKHRLEAYWKLGVLPIFTEYISSFKLV